MAIPGSVCPAEFENYGSCAMADAADMGVGWQ